MKYLLTRAKSFHKPDAIHGAPGSIVTCAPGEVEAPEWIRETNTYRAGVADGSIRDFAPAGQPAVFIPTKEQLIERGYDPEVADQILVQQRELASQFAAPPAEPKSKDEVDPATLGLSDGKPEPLQPVSPAAIGGTPAVPVPEPRRTRASRSV